MAKASSTRPGVDPRRRALLGRVHQAKKALALSDDSYRDLVNFVTGFRSAADCSDAQLEAVLRRFHELGWNPPPKGYRPRLADSAHGRKARALWLSLYQLGELRDASDEALDAFARRQTGIDSLRWVTPDKARKVIDALKAWCGRAGFVVPATTIDGGAEAKRRLVRAIWAKLCAALPDLAAADDNHQQAALWIYLDRVAGPPRRAGLEHLDLKQLDRCVERLGSWLRSRYQASGIRHQETE